MIYQNWNDFKSAIHLVALNVRTSHERQEIFCDEINNLKVKFSEIDDFCHETGERLNVCISWHFIAEHGKNQFSVCIAAKDPEHA